MLQACPPRPCKRLIKSLSPLSSVYCATRTVVVVMAVVGVHRPVEGEQDIAKAGVFISLSSLTFVLPPDVAKDRVACPPAFSIFWKTSRKRVSSSHVLMSESEIYCLLYRV